MAISIEGRLIGGFIAPIAAAAEGERGTEGGGGRNFHRRRYNNNNNNNIINMARGPILSDSEDEQQQLREDPDVYMHSDDESSMSSSSQHSDLAQDESSEESVLALATSPVFYNNSIPVDRSFFFQPSHLNAATADGSSSTNNVAHDNNSNNNSSRSFMVTQGNPTPAATRRPFRAPLIIGGPEEEEDASDDVVFPSRGRLANFYHPNSDIITSQGELPLPNNNRSLRIPPDEASQRTSPSQTPYIIISVKGVVKGYKSEIFFRMKSSTPILKLVKQYYEKTDRIFGSDPLDFYVEGNKVVGLLNLVTPEDLGLSDGDVIMALEPHPLLLR